MNIRTGALLSLALLLRTSPAGAQDVSPDPRWQAWIGCWQPVDAQLQPAPQVCVTAAPGTSAVDITTRVDGEVVSRVHVEASGERRAVERDGCTGWESARWSAVGTRVYLRADVTCAGGVRKRSEGMMAMTSGGRWLDLRGVSVAAEARMGVRVQRFEDAAGAAAGPERLAAGARLTTDDVIDASRALDPAILEAWLVERGDGLTLDAKRLAAMADAGVPAAVIDLVVAVSFPRMFVVSRTTREADARRGDSTYSGAAGAPGYAGVSYAYDCLRYAWSYYSSQVCDYDYYRYAPYGWNSWVPAGYYTGSPVVIVVGGGSTGGAGHGRVVKGQGYRQGAAGTDTPAIPAPATGTFSGSGGTGASAGASSSGSSSGGTRTAHPRPPSQ